jgi:outer membrane protein TolC
MLLTKLNKKMKKHRFDLRTSILIFFASIFMLQTSVMAQVADVLTIEECYSLARKNYPLVKQWALLEKTAEYNLENASKGYLPQIMINGQVTYQSAVTELPFNLPNLPFEPLSKDQYKVFAEINQPLTDALVISQQKTLIRTNVEIEEQKLETELYKLKERINQLFFGIHLIDAQLKQNELLMLNIRSGLDKINAAIVNGIATKSHADMLKAELLKAGQQTTGLNATKKGFQDMLALMINQQIKEDTKYQMPEFRTIDETITRPELKLFDQQKQAVDVQTKIVNVRSMPRASLFLQTGYGKPALNFLKNEFDFYYIGGLRLSWNLAGYYTIKNERQLFALKRDVIEIQKETFLFNTKLQLKQQNTDIIKLETLLQSDKEIISLRENIKNYAAAQFENGTITANDYIIYLNAEDQARQNLILHRVQLLLAQYNHQTTRGN